MPDFGAFRPVPLDGNVSLWYQLPMTRKLNLLREFSIPLLAGVLTALGWANAAPESYRQFNYGHFWGSLSFHFVANDIFMVFFFAIAAAEITQSCLPGGDLSPLGKAMNPLLATAGGVIGPVAAYLLMNGLIGSPALMNGWASRPLPISPSPGWRHG